MNKVYKITINKFDYNQYDAFIVTAESKQKAIEILKESYPNKDPKYSFSYDNEVNWKGGYKIKELDLSVAGIELESFNAG
jgi:hypothetical protein